MNVLVLGGSVFLGRAVVAEAVAVGADVTVFNRGRSGPTPPGARQVTGDRSDSRDLERLTDRAWDVVVDTSGYVPEAVGRAARMLEPVTGHYAFVSSVNAYPGWPTQPDYRDGGVHAGDPDATQAPGGLSPSEAYGWLKVGCERAVERAFGPERCAVLRGGSIVGPDDSDVGRLPWWIDRVARGGEVLVPGTPDDPVALIDARDLARFALSAVAGTFETPGPPDQTRGELMAACLAATNADASFTWVASDWLHGQGVDFWVEVPLWAPESEAPSVFRHHAEDAVAAGLHWRPLAETVADTWAWQRSVPGGWQPTPRTPGLAPERESELLAEWHARS